MRVIRIFAAIAMIAGLASACGSDDSPLSKSGTIDRVAKVNGSRYYALMLTGSSKIYECDATRPARTECALLKPGDKVTMTYDVVRDVNYVYTLKRE